MKPEELLHLFSPYLPTDRFRALLRNAELPVVSEGAALLADISGFTPMTTQFVAQYGPERASEEVKRKLNPMFEAIAGQVFHHGGSVIRFTGDGFIAWFSDNDPDQTLSAEVIIPAALRAIAAGLGMQSVMPIFRGLRLKICVGAGRTWRWVVGQPQYGLTDVLLGPAVEEMLSLGGEVQPGQIMIHRQAVSWLRHEGVKLELNDTGNATVIALPDEISKAVRQYRWTPWSVASSDEDALNAVRPFVDSAIRERVESGFGDYVAELRYAMPMFVQLNSIAPEVEGARDMLDKQVRSAQSVIASFGGRFVSVEMSDKGSVIFAVFGAPISYGDDAERAVRAALALRDMSVGSASGLSVQRIGLSRGLLYAGTIGGEVRHEYSTIGDETNIASRLMTAAETGQILTTSAVRHEIGPRIVFHDLEPITVKGRSEPIAITEPKSILQGSQQQAHVGELVGRTDELNQLHKLAQAALKGYPRIVRVEGQAGIGKSRLVAELVRLAVDEGFQAAGGDCVSTGRNMAYLPWRDVLISLLGLDTELSLEETTDQLYLFVEQANEDWVPRVPLLGDLLELPMVDSSITATLEGQTRNQALSTLVVEIIIHLARQQPVLIIMEDTHWIDELSEGLMIDLARQLNVDPAPVMLMLVHRPLTEADHPQDIIRVLADMHLHSHLTLNELSRAAVTEMIEKYLDASIPPELSRFIYDRAHGNPFFIQELTDTLIETGFIKVIGSLVFIERDLNAADLPHTVQKLVQARIDRLSETDKLVLKVAAVIGQQFQVNVLAKSIPISLTYEELLDCLRTLEARDFSYMESPEPELTYLFKHAITQEVTYQSLLFAQRRQLHQAVASTLEMLAPEATERLAYHFVRGGDTDRARHYLLMAGENAYREYANQAALTYFNQVQALARNDQERFEIDRRRLQIMLRLGDTQGVQRDIPDFQELAVRNERLDWQAEAHIFWGNYHAQTSSWGKVIEEAQRAITATRQIDNDELAWESYLLLRDAFLEINQREEAEALNATLHPIAERLGDPHRRIRLQLLESEDLYTADPVKAVEAAEATIGEAKALQDPILEAECWSTLARLHSRNNNLPLAFHAYGQQIALLRQVGDRRHEGLTLLSIGSTLVSMGELSEGNGHLLDAFKILHQIGERSGEAASLVNLGIIAQHHKAYDEGLAYMERGLAIQRDLAAEADIARTLFYMSNVFIEQRKLDEASKALAEAESLFAANSLPQYLDELSTAQSEINSLRNDLETARANIRPLLPRLARHHVEDLLVPGLAYWRTIHILQLRGEESLASQLHQTFRDFMDPILNSLSVARREAIINRIWYHAALLNSSQPTLSAHDVELTSNNRNLKGDAMSSSSSELHDSEPSPSSPPTLDSTVTPVASPTATAQPQSQPDSATSSISMLDTPPHGIQIVGINSPDGSDLDEEAVDTSNFFIFGDPKIDRDRLVAQAGVLSNFVRHNANRLLPINPKTILDIGCGEGQMSLALSKVFRQAHVIGIDQDPAAIEKAKEHLQTSPGTTGQNIEFMVGNVQEMLPPGPFDLIYGSLIFPHLENPEKVLQMCFDKLKPGGYLWIREMGYPQDPSQLPGLIRWMELMGSAMTKMKRPLLIANELRELLPRIGFTDLRDVQERYSLDETTVTGRIIMSATLANFWNMIPDLEKSENIPHDELVALHKELMLQLQSGTVSDNMPNIIAQRPGDLSADKQ